jgi:superfamily II DNA or RNA helicase
VSPSESAVATERTGGDATGGATNAERLLERARARFARSADADTLLPTLGSITLRPDQVQTARRVRAHLRRDGGCLLADDVGTGKTFVALALMREWRRPLIVAPASLRTTWEQAARRAAVECDVASHESLSRRRGPRGSFDAIVVDESHRFRATSRRHAELARLTAHAPVLMLSATPLQNRASELAAQIALFIGEVAYQLEPAQLTRWIVRSATRTDLTLPRVAPPRWLEVDADDGEVLRAILALPPPPRAADVGDAGALVLMSLVRAWASSQASLVATIRRRQRTLAAIEQCHQEGRIPTRRELRSWSSGGDVQLGFVPLLAASPLERAASDEMAGAIAAERAALDRVLALTGPGDGPDAARVTALRALRSRHERASILAFSESASTVRAYFAALRADAGVGMLTASEARIATGRIARDELLARFAPKAQQQVVPAAHQCVALLLSTDLLSEGVNLQDASVVVHLDLPWNPARLTQRLGRVRRPGGAREVSSYLMSPPANAALLLRAEARLRAKLARAEETIGRGIPVLPALGGVRLMNHDSDATLMPSTDASLSAAELWGEIDRLLARWRSANGCAAVEDSYECVVAAACADDEGWIALLDDGRLVAYCASSTDGATPTDSPELLAHALRVADGHPRDAPDHEQAAALAAIAGWIEHDWSRHSCGLATVETPLRRRTLRAIDAEVRHAARHRRGTVIAAAASVRRALAGPLPLGIERALDELVTRDHRTDWLERAVELLARRPTIPWATAELPPEARALILFGPQARR